MYLVDYAIRKSIQAMAAGEFEDEEAMLASSSIIKSYWQRAFDYAVQLRVGFTEHAAQLKREIVRSKMSEAEWYKARQVSRNFNLERYSAGMGSQGLNAPANVVVDGALEASSFHRNGNATGREMRYYYYGPEVPPAHQVVAPYMSDSGSPTKRRRASAHGAGDDNDMPFRPSPGSPQA